VRVVTTGSRRVVTTLSVGAAGCGRAPPRSQQGAATVAAGRDAGRGARFAAELGQATHAGLFGQAGAGDVGEADLGRVSPGLAAAGLQEIRPAGEPAEAGRAMR